MKAKNMAMLMGGMAAIAGTAVAVSMARSGRVQAYARPIKAKMQDMADKMM